MTAALLQTVTVTCEPEPKKLLIVGISGVGKSTVSNCLLNQRGDLEKIIGGPFPVSEDSGSGNVEFDVRTNKHFTIIDSIGFGSNEFSSEYVLERMREAMNKVDNEIDCVMYVFEKGRLTNETYQFISVFQNEVMKKKTKYNAMLIVNKCEKGWLAKPEQQNNEVLQAILDSVNNLSYELDLKWDHSTDGPDVEHANMLLRQKAINDFVNTLDKLSFSKVNVNHIQGKEFTKLWSEIIFSFLNKIARMIESGLQTEKTTKEIGEMVFIEVCRSLFKWGVDKMGARG